MLVHPTTATVDVRNADETLDLARRLGAALFAGAVVALEGPLGAGKTLFVRGVAEGLGIPDPRVVSSPTFVLIQEYAARLPIYHFDAYRLSRVQDFIDLGAHEYFEGDGVCLVEWADLVSTVIPPEHLWIRFAITGASERRLTLLARGAVYVRVLDVLTSRSESPPSAEPEA